MMSDRTHGVPKTWFDERHCGFIESTTVGRTSFAARWHFGQNDTAPQLGERYSFTWTTRGRPRATDIRYEGAEAAARQIFNPVRL